MATPLFISFEGIDGSGKSTQANTLLKHLTSTGTQAILVREPGSTPLGEHLRSYLKSQQPLEPMAELFLFEAARNQLVTSVIAPALQRGVTVITDRHTDSSIAYQGGGRGIDPATIEMLNQLATTGLTPDITFFLSIPPRLALSRAHDKAARFETQTKTFYDLVTDAYAAQAARHPDRIKTIHASMSEPSVTKAVLDLTDSAINNPDIRQPGINQPDIHQPVPQFKTFEP